MMMFSNANTHKIICVIMVFTVLAVSKVQSSNDDQVKTFVDKLTSSDQSQRKEAAIALGNIGDRRAVPPLIKALSKDLKADEIGCIVWALGELGDVRAVEPLLPYLSGFSLAIPELASKVATALGKIGDVRAVESLIELLSIAKFHPQVIASAASALGAIQDERAVEPLIKVLADDVAAPIAVQALGEIGDKRAVKPLVDILRNIWWEDRHPNLGVTVGQALKRINDNNAVNLLINLLKETSEVPRYAVDALGEIGDNRAIATLFHIARKDKEERIRFHATAALLNCGYSTAAEILIPFLEPKNEQAWWNEVSDEFVKFYYKTRREEILELLEISAKQGNIEAQYILAQFYYKGRYLPKNHEMANYWLLKIRKLAQQGDIGAQEYMCHAYSEGIFGSKDDDKLRYWLSKIMNAATLGNAEAQYIIGILLSSGTGLTKDEQRATEMFSKAANQGHPGAQAQLGLSYFAGKTVERDEAQAYVWLRVAMEQGEPAIFKYNRIGYSSCALAIDILNNNMSAAKIESLETQIRNWKTKR